MKVQCPNCDTKYRLDEERLGPDGSKVRCSRCRHVFTVFPPFADDTADTALDLDFQWHKDANTGEAVAGRDSQPPGKPRSRLLTLVLAAILLIVLALAGLLYFPGAELRVKSLFSGSDSEQPKLQNVTENEKGGLISLQNVRQYFVPNEKIGRLFVVEGKARNDFSTPMEMIKLEGSLFDDQGQVVERREFLAGNTVSLFQLQIMSQEELEAALNANVGILSNNTNLRPGMDVQFMTVFFNPPDSVQEYGLKVIEAQQPQ